jgi:hypothetical protein
MASKEEISQWRAMLAADRRKVERYRAEARKATTALGRENLGSKAQYHADHAEGLMRVIAAAEATRKPPEKSTLPTANQLYRDIMAARRGWRAD